MPGLASTSSSSQGRKFWWHRVLEMSSGTCTRLGGRTLGPSGQRCAEERFETIATSCARGRLIRYCEEATQMVQTSGPRSTLTVCWLRKEIEDRYLRTRHHLL